MPHRHSLAACPQTCHLDKILEINIVQHNYLRQGGNGFTPVGLLVCLSVNKITVLKNLWIYVHEILCGKEQLIRSSR